MSDVRRILEVLTANAEKPFVKRILTPEQYPVLQNEDESVSTHSMSWGEGDGKYFVYPTVVLEGKALRRLEDDEAWDYAQRTGNLIEMPSAQDADWFSKNYKLLWE